MQAFGWGTIGWHILSLTDPKSLSLKIYGCGMVMGLGRARIGIPAKWENATQHLSAHEKCPAGCSNSQNEMPLAGSTLCLPRIKFD